MTGDAQLASELRAVLEPLHERWCAADAADDAAVLVPLVPHAAGPALVFVKRRADLRRHAGQVAFPGGRREGDESPLACALRECEEELGVPPQRLEVLGSLPCRATGAGFLVHPFVALLHPGAALRPHPAEVEATFEVPVAALRAEARWEWRDVEFRGGVRRCPFFVHQEHEIWGLTARVTHDLLGRWR